MHLNPDAFMPSDEELARIRRGEINPRVKAMLDTAPPVAFTARPVTDEELTELWDEMVEARRRERLESN